MKDKYFPFIRLQMILCMILFCGWWGFLYPQLVLPEGTYRITYIKEDTDKMNETKSVDLDNEDVLADHAKVINAALMGEDLLKELESNEENKICIKSKLFSMLQEFLWENDNE